MYAGNSFSPFLELVIDLAAETFFLGEPVPLQRNEL